MERVLADAEAGQVLPSNFRAVAPRYAVLSEKGIQSYVSVTGVSYIRWEAIGARFIESDIFHTFVLASACRTGFFL